MNTNRETDPIVGLGTALLTPFAPDGQVDWESLPGLIEFQIENGANFLVPLGSTGEASTLSEEEQVSVVTVTLREAGGRIPVVVGCSHNNTQALIERASSFAGLGVRHLLSASPYYNKPTQEGIYQHYRALKVATGLNILAYTIPGRTGGNIAPETIARLAEEEVIFGLKEASGDILQIQQICHLVGERCAVFSGDDAMTAPVMAVGGAGVIAVAANVVPRAMRDWVDALLAGQYPQAREQFAVLQPLFEALSAEPNPIPIKAALRLMGHMEAIYRLPLVPPQGATITALQQALAPFLDWPPGYGSGCDSLDPKKKPRAPTRERRCL